MALDDKLADFLITATDRLARIEEQGKATNEHLTVINGTLEKHSKMLTAHDRALVRIRTISGLIGTAAGSAAGYIYHKLGG